MRKPLTISIDRELDAKLRAVGKKMRPRAKVSDLIEVACERYLQELENAARYERQQKAADRG